MQQHDMVVIVVAHLDRPQHIVSDIINISIMVRHVQYYINLFPSDIGNYYKYRYIAQYYLVPGCCREVPCISSLYCTL